MGMNPAEFWAMSWRDFQLKQRGFFELRNMDFRKEWEIARFVAYYSAAGFLKKGTKLKDIVRFDWEKEVKLPTKEEMRYWMLKYGKYLDENGNTYNA
jgi:hypothetical protein